SGAIQSEFETSSERSSRHAGGQASTMKDMNATLAGMQKALAATRPLTPQELEKKAKEAEQVQKLAEQQARDKALKELDSQFDEQVIAEIQAQAEAEAAGYKELIAEASAPPSDLADPQKAQKALAAIDRLIEEAKADKLKWEMLDQLSKGGMS